uniref:Uncharacterized protein n=1 Tax=Rhizophora mucronata TaxID=61149 RepID=A0A2P2PK94_RHIMU
MLHEMICWIALYNPSEFLCENTMFTAPNLGYCHKLNIHTSFQV